MTAPTNAPPFTMEERVSDDGRTVIWFRVGRRNAAAVSAEPLPETCPPLWNITLFGADAIPSTSALHMSKSAALELAEFHARHFALAEGGAL